MILRLLDTWFLRLEKLRQPRYQGKGPGNEVEVKILKKKKINLKKYNHYYRGTGYKYKIVFFQNQ